MIFPNPDKLEKTGSRYGLTTAAAKRAKQIKNGAMPLIPTESTNPLTIALEEIAAGKITFVVPDIDVPTRNIDEQDISGLFSLSVLPERLHEEQEGIEGEEDWVVDEDEPVLPLDAENDRTAAVDEFVEDETDDAQKAPILHDDEDDEENPDVSDIEPDIADSAIIDGEWTEDEENEQSDEEE